MARLEVNGLDGMLTKMQKLSGGKGMRDAIKDIVMAGAKAEDRVMRSQTEAAKHVKTGAMVGGIAKGEYREWIGGGFITVYPQGEDGKGVSNVMKAFVINYGRGKKTKKMGDKFITGKSAIDEAENAVGEAMRGEAEIAFKKMGITD